MVMRLERHSRGPRVYVLGLRLHHGLTGCVLIGVGFAKRKRLLIEAGMLLVADDRHDFPWSLRDRQNRAHGLTSAA